MHVRSLRFIIIVGSLLVSLNAGCSRTQPPTFYALASLSPETRASTLDLRGTTLAVGPVQLPEYVDRPQIVTQESQHRYELAEFDQWAEPIEDNFSRVLTDNLSTLLSPVQIAVIPWQSDLPATYRVQVDVTRFSGAVGAEAALRARWYIFGKEAQTALVTRQSSFSEAVSGQEYEALVAALSRTVEALSHAITAEIKALQEKAAPAP